MNETTASPVTSDADRVQSLDAVIRAVREYAQEYAGNGFAADLLQITEPALAGAPAEPELGTAAIAALLTRTITAIDEERLTDDTGEPEDIAYNQALDAAVAAIRKSLLRR